MKKNSRPSPNVNQQPRANRPSKKTTSSPIVSSAGLFFKNRLSEFFGACLLCVCAIVFLSLFTYSFKDSSYNAITTNLHRTYGNLLGAFGANLASYLLAFLGIAAYALLPYPLMLGWHRLRRTIYAAATLRLVPAIFFLLAVSCFFGLFQTHMFGNLVKNLGGTIGESLAKEGVENIIAISGFSSFWASSLLGILVFFLAFFSLLGIIPMKWITAPVVWIFQKLSRDPAMILAFLQNTCRSLVKWWRSPRWEVVRDFFSISPKDELRDDRLFRQHKKTTASALDASTNHAERSLAEQNPFMYSYAKYAAAEQKINTPQAPLVDPPPTGAPIADERKVCFRGELQETAANEKGSPRENLAQEPPLSQEAFYEPSEMPYVHEETQTRQQHARTPLPQQEQAALQPEPKKESQGLGFAKLFSSLMHPVKNKVANKPQENHNQSTLPLTESFAQHNGACDEPLEEEAKIEPREQAYAPPHVVKKQETTFSLPPLDVLDPAKPPKLFLEDQEQILEETSKRLEGVLHDFSIKGQIVQVRTGPVVTLYELEPSPGTKSARVISLADDIARSMSTLSARVAVVPGKNAIGIELPNRVREAVLLRDILEREHYQQHHTTLPLALGKDIGGTPVVADLSRMPHLLIAGTTGSGKSVGINAMILSLLYKLSPDECKMIMVDPKMLELSVYNHIPHLLAPVVTEPKKAVTALKWVVKEMERRYKLMSLSGARNITSFNERLALDQIPLDILEQAGEVGLERMPYIVVVIDEMADLMMVAGKEIEVAVQRLAQMARAAGIHMIMATQRPSVDVITGTIKANFPTRISFQVTSKIDSRTILGEQGAEQLLGQGDMLYMMGGGRLQRVHGPFVSDMEVERVTDFLRSQGKPDYMLSNASDLFYAGEEDDEEGGGNGGSFGGSSGGSSKGNDSLFGGEDEEEDPNSDAALYKRARHIVLEEQKASTSYVQRRLRIGYNRAAQFMEMMEEEGVVSEQDHKGKRNVLIEKGETA